MRPSAKRIVAALALVATAALTVTLPASPAGATGEPFKSPDTGLVFYASGPVVAGRQATPDGACRPVPAGAIWLLAWSGGFRSVAGYRTADCSGPASELNNFHSWPEGRYLSYRA